MEGPNLGPYTYQLCPLPHLSKSARVLRIYPGNSETDPVICGISVIPNEEDKNFSNFSFEALSYAWGELNDYTEIYIVPNDEVEGVGYYTTKISKTLEAALRGLRHPNRPRLIWCDQLCVDQGNVQERNAQVASMTNIYGMADNVVVWLGKENPNIARAMNFIQKLVTDLDSAGMLEQTKEIDADLEALSLLLGLPWFSRRWVIQEITLAKNATLQCGNKTIPWSDFADGIALCANRRHELSRLVSDVRLRKSYEGMCELNAYRLIEATEYIERRTSHMPGRITGIDRLYSLEFLVTQLSNFETSNPRDTIYALLSISKDAVREVDGHVGTLDLGYTSLKNPYTLEFLRRWGRDKIQQRAYNVHYEQSEVDVWKSFIGFVVDSAEPSQCLDILHRAWAPNLGTLSQTPTWVCTTANRPFRAYSWRQHSVERINADPLVGIPGHQGNYEASGRRTTRPTLKFESSAVLERARKYDGQRTTSEASLQDDDDKEKFDSLYLKGFVLDGIERLGEWSHSGNIPADWFKTGGWTDMDNVPQDFWRTIVANRGTGGRPVSRIYPRFCTYCLGTGVGARMASVPISEIIKYKTSPHSQLMTDFLDRARIGDLICILWGCSVPVVLRPCRKTPQQLQYHRRSRQATKREQAAKMFRNALRRKQMRSDMMRAVQSSLQVTQAEPSKNTDSSTASTEPLARTTQPPIRTTMGDGISVMRGVKREASPQTRIMRKRQRIDEITTVPPTPFDPNEATTPSWERSALSSNDDVDLFYYELIGEAYIHDMMSGEALELQRKLLNDGEKQGSEADGNDEHESIRNVTFELR